MTKVYSAVEIAKHNTANDLWMIIHGGVYDLTKFLHEHPGGEEVLLNLAGTDGTECFDEMGHTSDAIKLRETFKIGVLVEGDKAASNLVFNTKNAGDIDDDNWEYEPPKEKPNNLKYIFAGALVAVYAFMYFYLL